MAEGGPGYAGNDLIVSLGDPAWPTVGGTDDEKAGTYMHELGHTLGLGHGGVDNVNHKPNYISVMNYAWQVPAVVNASSGSSRIRRRTLPPQNEAALDETTGLAEIPTSRSRSVRRRSVCACKPDRSTGTGTTMSSTPGVVADITQIDASVPADTGSGAARLDRLADADLRLPRLRRRLGRRASERGSAGDSRPPSTWRSMSGRPSPGPTAARRRTASGARHRSRSAGRRRSRARTTS
jgi:hypothetical protein